MRDLAILHVAYAALLRISELGRLRVRDVTRASDGRIVLDVVWTKTIVQTSGLIKALGELLTTRLTEWLTHSGLISEPDAYIFGRAWHSAGSPGEVKANKGHYRAGPDTVHVLVQQSIWP